MIDLKKELIFSIIDSIIEDKERSEKTIGRKGLKNLDQTVFEYVEGLIKDKNPLDSR